MALYITHHALDRAIQRLGYSNPLRVRDEALASMIFGKRRNNTFVYHGVVWAFNSKLDVLKTVYREA